MKIDAFGLPLKLIRVDGRWYLYLLGNGKRTEFTEFAIPFDYDEAAVLTFISDMLHENASPQNPDIKILK